MLRVATHTRFTMALVGLTAATLLGACNGHRRPDARDTGQTENVATASFFAQPAFAQAQAQAGDVTLADVAEQALPSVVSVATERTRRQTAPGLPFNDPLFRRFFGIPEKAPRERLERGLGSGVYFGDGVVVTNYHVIEDAETITVTTSGQQELQAEVVGTDPPSDIAVLKLQGNLQGLKPAAFGDSSDIRLGDVVLAIGNPFGVGKTVTMGIISAKGRANVGITDYEDFIQTDAAINPGNSGGALVNMEGKVIGINTAILSRTGGYMGIGFAVPSNMVKPIVSSLLEHGRVIRGWLGVAIQDVTPELAKALGLDTNEGVLVASVEPSSPAAKAGLERGDVITAVDGTPVDSSGKLRNLIASSGAGAKTKLKLQRDGKEQTVEVELGELPAKLAGKGAGEGGEADDGLAGMSLENLNPATRQRFEIPDQVQEGVVVTQVEPATPAARAGLRPGDVILELNRKGVQDLATFRRVWRSVKGNALLLVQRQGQTLFMVVQR